MQQSNSEIKKSPDDWGYILYQYEELITRVWAMPSGTGEFYDIYQLDKPKGFKDFGYVKARNRIPKNKVDGEMRKILG